MEALTRRMRRAYMKHRNEAGRRGVEFLFTWEEWRDWWLTDGRWSRRGTVHGAAALVMGRHGDTGPYAVYNVYPATVAENNRDADRFRAERMAA